MTTSELVEDAEIEEQPRRRFWGPMFRGLLWGIVVFGGIGIALSLSTPLPDHLPGIGKVDVVGAPAAVAEDSNVSPAETSDSEQSDAQPEPNENEQATGNQTAVGDEEAGAETGVSADAAESEEQQAAATATDDEQAEAEPAADATSDNEVSAETEPATADAGATSATEEAVSEEAQTAPETAESETLTEDNEAATPAQDTEGETAAEETPASEESDQVAALAPADETPAVPVEAPTIALPGPALAVNARPFDELPNAPLMAVVLQDAGNGAIAPDMLQFLTMPLTMAISPESANSRDFAEAAVAAGHEILVQMPLAVGDGDDARPGLTAEEPAEALSLASAQALARLDLAVGATAPDGAGMLRTSPAMAALTAPMVEHGFAWVEPRAGAGGATQRLSSTSDLVYAQGNRVVGAGATSDQIYQVIEGAAFQARRDGTTIVFLSASQEALQALVRWGLERGGQEVWFAPVSAVIARQQGG